MTYSALFKTLKTWGIKAAQKLLQSKKKPTTINNNNSNNTLNFYWLDSESGKVNLSKEEEGSAIILVSPALPNFQFNTYQIHEDDPDSGDDPNGSGGQIHEDDPDPGDQTSGSMSPIHEDDPDSGDDPNSTGGQIHEDDPDPGDETGGSGGNAPRLGKSRLIAKLTLPQNMKLRISRA